MSIVQTEITSSEIAEPKARPRNLAFLLPSLVDFSNITGLQKETLALADSLRGAAHMPEGVRKRLRLALDETLSQLEAQLAKPRKHSVLTADVSNYLANSHFKPKVLAKDYGQDNIVGPNQILTIPTDKITAAQALPYDRKPGADDFDPTIHLRIQSSLDKPTHYYNQQSQFEEQSSDGRWYSFPLYGVELSLLTRIGGD